MKVLVADDDALFLKVITEILTDAGHEVVTALDGDEALEKAVTERPDLIILDIILPKHLGTEVSEKLRKYRHSASVPILLVSSGVSDMEETGGTLDDFLADDFMQKPFSADELLKRIDQLSKAPSRHTPSIPEVDVEIELEEIEPEEFDPDAE
jgi:two-component system alkaline phosphatase synthesis response regulator PhoP